MCQPPVWMPPDGNARDYDKRHLFRMAREHERYGGGDDAADRRDQRLAHLSAGLLRPALPGLAAQPRTTASTKRFDYDLVLFVANWPAARRYAWRTLLRARAIENLGYCVGVNRVGIDGNDLHYAGDSAVIDFLGQPLIELGAQEQVVTVTLDA